jgi:nitroimidazol reductase NimA-like FMN-containing flavoprotein (pyridoxamine 5'-phosphate oxidase superfamily)
MDISTYHNKGSDGVGTATSPLEEASSEAVVATPRTTLKRHPERGRFERDEIYDALDAGWVCHLGISTDDGPVVIPTSYARQGDTLLIHGSPASRLLRSSATGIPICVTVTHIDGLVLARSTYHHSVNFRSVVVFGRAVEITDPDAKAEALAAFVEHIVPGRTADARAATPLEVRGTKVLAVPLDEASLKVRTGGPSEEPEDYALPVWAGVLPLTTAVGTLVPDDRLDPAVPVPAYLAPAG